MFEHNLEYILMHNFCFIWEIKFNQKICAFYIYIYFLFKCFNATFCGTTEPIYLHWEMFYLY